MKKAIFITEFKLSGGARFEKWWHRNADRLLELNKKWFPE